MSWERFNAHHVLYIFKSIITIPTVAQADSLVLTLFEIAVASCTNDFLFHAMIVQRNLPDFLNTGFECHYRREDSAMVSEEVISPWGLIDF